MGIFYIKYNDAITRATGSISWAENKLGGGGTYTFHKLVGLVIIVISVLSITGTFQWILQSTLGTLFSSTGGGG